MAVQLTKGARVNLSKQFNLKKALAGLGWDINRYEGSADFDLDLVIFECDKNNRCLDDQHLIFYNNMQDPETAVKHSGDNRTGAGDGDDESVHINFDAINPNVEKLVVAVTIYEAKARNQNFGMVDNAYIRVINEETGEEVARYDLTEEYSIQTSLVVAEFYKKNGDWSMRAVGEGYAKELVDFCREYGLDIA